MDNALIRRMTIDDVPQVHAIEQATFPLPWTLADFTYEMTSNPVARYVVAEQEGVILGFVGAHIILDEGHITNVAVIKEARGHGLGRLLMDALMQLAANLGARYLTLEVRASNAVAVALYRSLGFIKVSVRKKYYDDNGEDALLMVCDQLPPAQDDFQEDKMAAE